MKQVLGITLLILLSPLYLFLYIVAVVGEWVSDLAADLFNYFYEPIYNLAGKPLDKR